MSAVIVASEQVKKGINIINLLDSGKFPLLLTRIIKAVQNKAEKSFSENEEIKLQASLNINIDDVRVLLSTLQYIFEQVVYYLVKPSSLSQQLIDVGIDENKVNDIVQVWSSNAKSLVEKLTLRSIAPDQLEDVNWQLDLRLSNSKKAKEKSPCALFKFDVKNSSEQSIKPFVVEFSHEELSKFYNQLETIQSQLDSLR